MTHLNRRIVAILKKDLFAMLVFLWVLFHIFACSTAPPISVNTLPQYDALFANQESWTGGDGVYSAALNHNTISWFFGDTWISQIKNNRQVNATLVNNSVAIQQGKDPATAKMTFYYQRTAAHQPAAFIRPEDDRGWFWIFDGVVTPAGLYVFLIQIERTPDDAVFNFKVVGNWLGWVANPDEAPTHWRITQTKVPWSTFSEAGGELWGSAILQLDDFVYIYGTAEHASPNRSRKHMILARVPVPSLADFSQWRFFADGNWVSDHRRVSLLSPDMPHEYSVTYAPALRRFVAVYSEDGLSDTILLRLSPKPQGPWGEPIPIFQCPEAGWDDSIFCYAAKAHSALSERPEELIVTYIANSVDFNTVVDDTRLYRPRFLQITFSNR
ncbi:MAG: DUF4185 domain-containing protein [Desulfobacterales bacterium]|jgi:hypothetical protein